MDHQRQTTGFLLLSLICLCAACHAQIHRLLSIWKWLPAVLLEFWTEQHPGVPVQLQISLSAQLELPFEGREVSRA
jgi:hypothetical protein